MLQSIHHSNNSLTQRDYFIISPKVTPTIQRETPFSIRVIESPYSFAPATPSPYFHSSRNHIVTASADCSPSTAEGIELLKKLASDPTELHFANSFSLTTPSSVPSLTISPTPPLETGFTFFKPLQPECSDDLYYFLLCFCYIYVLFLFYLYL
jgi:hypothetical protein